MFVSFSNIYDKFKADFPHRTREALIRHGKEILKPVAKYYHTQFKSDDGDCHPICEMSDAMDMFNPEWLANNIDGDTGIVLELHRRVDKLKAFQYRPFNKILFDGLKKEMKLFVLEAKADHDLGKIKPSEKYKTRLQKRIKKKKRSAETFDFRDDAGEYSERIFAWMKPRRQKFPYHALALRLVVLTQLSSCSVERVFSKLEGIHHVCGDNLFEDMTEVRLFLQCNGDLATLANALKNVTD